MLIGKNKWKGRKASIYTGTVEKIREWIPLFTRTSEWQLVDEGRNKYLDVIIRESLENDAEYIKDRLKIPVCTVTKQYHLFQHRDVFNALVRALKKIISDSESLETTLVITEYGERMWVRFILANFQLNEAERYPMLLEVSALNTVVPGTALDIQLSWYDPDSKARIPYGMLSAHEVNFKKIARKKAKAQDSTIFPEVNLFLTNHLKQLSRERESYKRWKKAKVSRGALARWIDTVVRRKWRYEEAVRIYHLIIKGRDVEVRRPTNVDEDQKGNNKETLPAPSKLPDGPLPPPSAFCLTKDPASSAAIERFTPARHAFDVSIVLAWIVSRGRTIPDRLRWTDIPELMEALVAEDEQLKRGLR